MARLLRGISRTHVIGRSSQVHGRVRERQSDDYVERDARVSEERERAWWERRTREHAPGTPPAVEDVRRSAVWESHFT